MQATVTVFPLLVALATAAPFDQLSDYLILPDLSNVRRFTDFPDPLTNITDIKWPDVMYFPDENGEPAPAQMYGNESARPVQPSDVFFKLYTRNGPTDGEIIVTGDPDCLKNSHFNASEPTFFLTHGYIQSIEAPLIQNIKDRYIAHMGCNVIAVDWSAISKTALYFLAAKQTSEVGQFVGAFAAFLAREGGMNVKHLHMIGHSLGAHVVGKAGKAVYLSVGQKCGRITGLDPAGPMFHLAGGGERIDKDDADFVDVIHTCGGWLGMYAPIGDADYYPNGGNMMQPGCSLDIVMAGVCSHSRVVELYAESINSRGFSARYCASYQDYLRDRCDSERRSLMGHHAQNSARGTFYLATAGNSPYAMS